MNKWNRKRVTKMLTLGSSRAWSFQVPPMSFWWLNTAVKLKCAMQRLFNLKSLTLLWKCLNHKRKLTPLKWLWAAMASTSHAVTTWILFFSSSTLTSTTTPLNQFAGSSTERWNLTNLALPQLHLVKASMTRVSLCTDSSRLARTEDYSSMMSWTQLVTTSWLCCASFWSNKKLCQPLAFGILRKTPRRACCWQLIMNTKWRFGTLQLKVPELPALVQHMEVKLPRWNNWQFQELRTNTLCTKRLTKWWG